MGVAVGLTECSTGSIWVVNRSEGPVDWHPAIKRNVSWAIKDVKECCLNNITLNILTPEKYLWVPTVSGIAAVRAT